MTTRRIVVDHVGLVVRDLAASRRFYAAALAPLGFGIVYEEGAGVALGVEGADDFGVDQARLGEASTAARSSATKATCAAVVDAVYVAALAAGGRDEDAPRLHPEYHPGYYAAYVWDPDGNNIEAVVHERD